MRGQAWKLAVLLNVLLSTGSARSDAITEDLKTTSVEQGFVENFTTETKEDWLKHWHVAEYRFTHPHFDTDWRKAQVVFSNASAHDTATLTLELSPQNGVTSQAANNKKNANTANRFFGGSIRREIPTHFGRYEATLQAAKGPGVVTGFFTYTGPAYGTRHDEIDIEFLGKNTRQIHIAWFVDGHLRNRFIDLPFDAAAAPHRYAFDWLPDRLQWWVDDTLIYTHHQKDGAIPTVPSRLFANIWAADPKIAAWSGIVRPGHSAKAYVTRISFSPLRPEADIQKEPTLMAWDHF